jgi:hypothetical protein
MRPAILLTPLQRLAASHERRMAAVRALQDSTSSEPVRARNPLGRDPDRHQFSEPPPGWPGTEGSIYRRQF